MNFVVKLEDGTYFNPKATTGKVPDIQGAEKFHSKSVARRILVQSEKLQDAKIAEIILLEKESK